MSPENPHLQAAAQIEDRSADLSLRPKQLSEFVGQDKIKKNLSIFLQAAQGRGEPLDHLLLYGPPGLGKTTVAHIIAIEMQVPIHVTTGPAIERPGDLVGILTNLDHGAILFIDEIHRLSRTVEEILYPAMEDGKVDVMIGKGPAARSVRIDVPQITVVGATTRQGLLTGPLRDRFGISCHFEFYETDSLGFIIERSSRILGYHIDASGVAEIAKRSRGTPRIANRLLRRVRDFAQVMKSETITSKIADHALDALEVDHLGLDTLDRRVLRAIIEKYSGGPVGLETIAASIGEDAGTIEDVCEPFLLQSGLIQRTPRGRCATKHAFAHLGLAQPNKPVETPGLFES